MEVKQLIEVMEDEGYIRARKLPSGEWAALLPLMFTTGLCVGIDRTGYRTRFCYRHYDEAFRALMAWDGQGDPPGAWVKEKGRLGERENPTIAGIPVLVEKEKL